jgi:hypothetical protein
VSQEQLQRINITENAVKGRLSVSEAATLSNLSGRQAKRLKGSPYRARCSLFQHRKLPLIPARTIADRISEKNNR